VLIIPGIDIEKGLATTMGKEDRYRRLLKIFNAEARQKHDEIRVAVDDRDINSFRICVHAIKSTAATVGATALSEQAGQLEDAARLEDWVQVDANCANFLDNLVAIYTAIDHALTQAASSVTVDKTRLSDILTTLRRAFVDFDMRGINTQSAALKNFLDAPELGTDVERILSNKRAGEYDAAIADIDILMAKLT